MNTIRTNLSMGYENYDVRTGMSRPVSSSATTAADGGVNAVHTGEKFTPSAGTLNEADAAEAMLLKWTQAETTPDSLGSSAQMGRDVGFEAPAASAAADPGNLNYLTGGLDFESGGIGSHLLGGNGGAPTERAAQAEHEGYFFR